MKKLFLVIAAALLGGGTVALWTMYRTEPNRGRMSEADQRFLSGGQNPTTLQTPTPFQHKMWSQHYQLDTRTRRWYPLDETFWKYHCYFDGAIDHMVLHCPPGVMPPDGIPDEDK